MPPAYFPPAAPGPVPGGFALSAHVITMDGTRYALFRPKAGGEPQFPGGPLELNEAPADAARRLVREWTGTGSPKLELVDMLSRPATGDAPWRFELVFRALLTETPSPGPAASEMVHKNRMELPTRVGTLEGRWVEDALKTGLNYKLTRT